ncbi:hypothetical protein D3C72_2479430 [compost metagenome]
MTSASSQGRPVQLAANRSRTKAASATRQQRIRPGTMRVMREMTVVAGVVDMECDLDMAAT